MGVIQRQGIKQSLATYFGVLIGVVNLLYIYPLTLQKEELGLVRFFIDTSLFIVPFTFLGSNTTIIRYFPNFKNEDKKHNGLLFFFCAILAVGLLFFMAIWLIFNQELTEYYINKDPLFGIAMPYVLPLVFLMAYSQLFTNYAANFKRIVIPSMLNDLLLKIGQPLLASAYFLSYISLSQVFLGIVVIYSLVLTGQIIYLIHLKQFHLKPRFDKFKKPILKEMANYSLYGILGSVGSQLAARIDIIMLANLSTLDNAGIYVIPLFISNVIEIPRRAIARITSPLLAEKWREKKYAEIQDLYQKSSLNQLIFGIWVLIGIWASIDDLFAIIPNGEEFVLGKYVVLILGTARVIDMVTGVNSEIIGYSKYFRYNFYLILCLAVFNVIANYLLIPEHNVNGAALATLASVILYNFCKFIILKWKLNMLPFSWETLWVILLGIATYFIVFSFAGTPWILVNMIIKSILITALFWGGVLYFKLSPELNSLVKGILTKIRNR